MQVRKIMTEGVRCIPPETTLQDAARQMRDLDVGPLPICDQDRLTGVLTDRDITIRTIAHSKNPLSMFAGEVMTTGPITVREDASFKEALDAMEAAQIRRILVVDKDGACCGIVSQADIALKADEHETAVLVKDVSA